MFKKIYPPEKYKSLEKKLILAGMDAKPETHLFLKLIISILFAITILIIFSALIAIIMFMISILFYDYIFLESAIKKRKYQLEEQALYFFEIFTLAIETENNLEKAIELTCNNIESELSLEFQKLLLEIKFGKTLEESIKSLQMTIPSENINNVLSSLSDTSTLGTKIKDVLKYQIKFLRKQIFLQKKSQINQIPVKISIMSVLLILPLVLLLILGPLVINLIG